MSGKEHSAYAIFMFHRNAWQVNVLIIMNKVCHVGHVYLAAFFLSNFGLHWQVTGKLTVIIYFHKAQICAQCLAVLLVGHLVTNALIGLKTPPDPDLSLYKREHSQKWKWSPWRGNLNNSFFPKARIQTLKVFYYVS